MLNIVECNVETVLILLFFEYETYGNTSLTSSFLETSRLRLNENLINKRKIQKHLKSNQRRIQNPVKARDGDSLQNSQPLQEVNCFLKNLHFRRLTSNLIASSANIQHRF